MYEFKSMFLQEIIDRVEVTPDVHRLAEMFGQKIRFDQLSSLTRDGAYAKRALKTGGCETLGDAYYFIEENAPSLGRRTAESLIFYLLDAFIPCSPAGTIKALVMLGKEVPMDSIKGLGEFYTWHGRMLRPADVEGLAITPEIRSAMEVFQREINFDDLTARIKKALKVCECRDLGDACCLAAYGQNCLGRKTWEEIIFTVLYAFTPCKYAVEVEKALQLSRKDAPKDVTAMEKEPADAENVPYCHMDDMGMDLAQLMNDDLISKSALLNEMRKFVGNQKYLISEKIWSMVENAPVVFNTNKVLEEVGKRMFAAECYNDSFDGKQINNLLCYGDVAEIICEGGIEEKKETLELEEPDLE